MKAKQSKKQRKAVTVDEVVNPNDGLVYKFNPSTNKLLDVYFEYV